VLLTGYGGFNVSLTPGFSALAILWAELGGVWARPSLRGGSEFGETWHRAGMLEKKQNVFDDFIAAAEWLVKNKVTNPSRLAISGTSNGGLLVGAALTQRPDLFRAVYCGYPDLDMVRYYRYTKNNNAPALLEYGDGSIVAQFPFLRSWSPYERVSEGTKYPAVLLATGAGDTRVPPQQAVKMAAKLQWATRSGLPVLLRFDRKSGHAGGRPQSKVIEDLAGSKAAPPDLSVSTEGTAGTTFGGPKGAFMVNWTYIFHNYDTDAPQVAKDIGYTMYPRTLPSRPARPPYGGIGIGVSRFSQHVGMATKALACLTSPTSQGVNAKITGNMPSSAAGYQYPPLRKIYPADLLALFQKSLVLAAPRSVTPYWSDISSAIQSTWHSPTSVNARTPQESAAFIEQVLQGKALL